MGMPVIVTSNIDRCDAVTDIIQSVALEQAALAHILNAEGEKIQKIVALDDATTDDMLEVNKSVKSMIGSIARLEMILQSKLELFEDCLCDGCSCDGKTLEDSEIIDASADPTANPAAIDKIDATNWSIRFKSGNGSKDFEIIPTPDLPLTEESLASGMSFTGNVLTVGETPGTETAIIKAGEGSCAELITISVTKQ